MDVAAEWTRFAEKDQPASKEERADEEEFTSLVERNARRMFLVAYSLLRNPHDAEDAVQEAFLKLYRTEGWRRMENERAFLSRTVWRVALDRLPPARAMEDTAEIEIAPF